MSGTFKTEQENFWAGSFGSEYISRNENAKIFAGKLALFSKILARTTTVSSAVELGANIGLNLRAINMLLPEVGLSAVEINPDACNIMRQSGGIDVFNESLLEFKTEKKWDFVLSMGVLIHQNPEALIKAYEVLNACANKYVCIAEYYNPSPVEIPYRGFSGKLFKRDFAGEFMEQYPAYRLVDYGFVYKNDPNYPLDDITWFLMEK